MKRTLAFALAAFALVAVWPVVADNSQAKVPSDANLSPPAESVQQGLAMERMDLMPVAFTENQGQWDERVKFRANTGGVTLWFTTDAVYYQFTRRIPKGRSAPDDLRHTPHGVPDHKADSIEQLIIKAEFVGANPNPEIIGKDVMEYRCNYLIGNDPGKWQIDVPNCRSVVFENVYPGIDLRYHTDGRTIEHDFIVRAGAEITVIEIAYEGAKSLFVNPAGDLVIDAGWCSIIERAPVMYKVSERERTPVSGEYQIVRKNKVGFAFKDGCNPPIPSVIDLILVYGTYLGGTYGDWGRDITVDANGMAFITGCTASFDFPTYNPYQENQGDADAFVTKLNSRGNLLVYSTYLGGDDFDGAYGIALDDDGNVYITGQTMSIDFPLLNAYQTEYGGEYGDAFVAKLNSNGNGLIYSTYLGGGSTDRAWDIAVCSSGNGFITGETYSTDFPTLNPHQTHQAGRDVFVTKLNSTGDGLLFSTYLGGGHWEAGHGIVADDNGNVYVAGYTGSSDFPTFNPYQTHQGNLDVFVTKLSSDGDSLLYSTYLGGGDDDAGYDVATDSDGNAFITGETASSDFPILFPYQADQGGTDAFVTRLNSSGSDLIHSTYLGGSDWDHGYGIVIDRGGNAYITGWTFSADFPSFNPYQMYRGSSDAFITKLKHGGGWLAYSTHLGGSGSDQGRSIAIDSSGNAYIVGETESSDFPTHNSFQTHQSSDDVFVVKISGQGSLCGDADFSSAIDIDDVVYLINYIFTGGPEPLPYASGDADCSGDVDIDDVVYLISYIFSGGNAPCDPDGDGVPDC